MPHATISDDSSENDNVLEVQLWEDPRTLTSFQTFPRASSNGHSRTRSDVSSYSGCSNEQSPSTNGSCSPISETEILTVVIPLASADKRFGFSVIGGVDENVTPKIEAINPGSPADRADLEVGDEILEVNGKSLENCTHTEVISHIHQCIRSRTICLRVKRKTGGRLALDLAQNSNVQDAFVIAVEQQARERLERLSALKKIKPVDMTKLSQELNECPNTSPDLNGVIENNPIYVTSVPQLQTAALERFTKVPEQPGVNKTNGHCLADPDSSHDQELELKQEIVDVLPSPRKSPPPLPSLPPPDVVSDYKDVFQDTRTMEIGPHREMAVDVPDSFVGVSKTPPRYPPPKPADSLSRSKKAEPRTTSHGSRPQSSRGSSIDTSPSHSMDGGQRPHANGKVATSPPPATASSRTTQVNGIAPTDEQLERIRKYQEDIRKRKEEEERLAKEEEFLRSSLRGSKKLQALEKNPPAEPRTGIVNTAFQLEDDDDSTDTIDASQPVRPTHPPATRTYESEELLDSLDRVESYLKDSKVKDVDLSPIETLIKNPNFQKSLAISNKVQDIWCFNRPPTPVCSDAQDIVQEVIASLQECSLPEASELLDILSKFELEGLIYSHDKIAQKQSIPAATPDEVVLDQASQYTEESVKIVRIDKTNEPLGATVRNEGESVIIGRIVKGGAAEKSGLLHEGDEILEVNGIEMRGKSVNDVCDILATMTGTLTFLIVPSPYEHPKGTSRDTMIHVKAHFDYDPDDDLYIPCRELGISFQKGDILHVINQDDANWWQAYREGEEDQTLAGLIPSKSFQQQREAMKQTIVGGDTNNKEKSKKGKFLCAKKHHKKKKKKVMYNANVNEDFDTEQILTYEEVALYYPRANRKRPVVLIGPSNIGRHELRQKLMEDTERFAAAVPHTSRPRKDAEVDGVDYHFISRAQFEADILAGKFVEHGEYERNYYGTSLDAIRSVVNSGKICVLNLHPQSLKILKFSDLKPYVVFVAPPSLEKLRQNRAKMGTPVKDDELKDIIEKAREMEENYGHYFDMIIINSDIEKAYNELLKEINILEREPQWVPSVWLKNDVH